MGALSGGNETLREALYSDNPVTFFEAQQADRENEMMPGTPLGEGSQESRLDMEGLRGGSNDMQCDITTKDDYMSQMSQKKTGGRTRFQRVTSPNIKTN